jgi:diadenosine tetraphosphate (Ap4A) HIT family hydrolase
MDAADLPRQDAVVSARTWPDDWSKRRAGVNCPTCAQGRPNETRGGVRFLEGQVTDVYLRRSAPLPGYSMAVWRGRHAADLTELSDDELAAYWRDIATACRALYAVFEPAQINYLTYGNNVPHVHTYLLLRYIDDTSPGMPLQPFIEHPVRDDALADQLSLLRKALAMPSV